MSEAGHHDKIWPNKENIFKAFHKKKNKIKNIKKKYGLIVHSILRILETFRSKDQDEDEDKI